MTTTDKTYNGWTNYETWNVKLWMDNDQGSDAYYREVAQEVYDDAEASKIFTKEERATLNLSDRLKDEYEEAMCEMLKETGKECSVWADLLGAALSEVNWREIAEHFIDEVDKDEPETDDEE